MPRSHALRFEFQSTRGPEGPRDACCRRGGRLLQVSIHARPRRTARRHTAFVVRGSDWVSIHARPRRTARRRMDALIFALVSGVSIHARPRRTARLARVRLICTGVPQFQSTRGPEGPRDPEAPEGAPKPPAFQSTRGPEGPRDSDPPSRQREGNSFNPRAAPKDRATCTQSCDTLDILVSIHARPRRTARPYIWSVAICAP